MVHEATFKYRCFVGSVAIWNTHVGITRFILSGERVNSVINQSDRRKLKHFFVGRGKHVVVSHR